MRILYICADGGIPIRGHKGAAVHVRALTDAFSSLGHSVTLVTSRAGPDDGPSPAAALVEVRPCEGEPPPEAVYRQARRLLATERFDLLYERFSLGSDAGARLADESGVPLVLEVNAPLRQEAVRYRALPAEEAERTVAAETRSLAAASAVAVVSAPLRDYAIAQGANPARVHVLPNAVDEGRFHPAVNGEFVRARYGLADKLVVGFVGTVKPWHEVDTLIEAVVRLQSGGPPPRLKTGLPAAGYHLLLVGNIPASVRETLNRDGLARAVVIVDPVPHPDVPAYLGAMDIAVSPHPPLEGFYFSPLKLFEYLACGVATVAARVGPVADVITDETHGLLYPAGQADALAQQIGRLAADPALRTCLGWQAAVHVLSHHTWRRNASQIIEWIAPSAAGHLAEARPDVPQPLLDDKLRRRLYRATRPDVAGPLLAAHLGWEARVGGRIPRVEVLKYKPRRRCVIAYDLGSGPADPDSRIIGKVFRDERGQQLFALHQALWDDGFGLQAADHVTVARPLAYIPEMRMFAQERAPGLTLDAFLDAPDFNDRVRRSAATLAKLHSTRVQPLARPPYPLEAELASLGRWAADLADWRPEAAEGLRRQFAALRSWAASLPPAGMAPSHRDFYYSQILFDDPRVTLIDLDMFSLADPAIDAANFAAHLRFLAMQHLPDPHSLDGAAALFVEEYCRLRTLAQEFFERLTFYQAATFYRLMHVVLQRPQLEYCFPRLFDTMEQELASKLSQRPGHGQ